MKVTCQNMLCAESAAVPSSIEIEERPNFTKKE